MKKVLFPIIALIVLTTLLLSGCDSLRLVRGSGDIVDKQYDFQGFSAIEASYAFAVDITHSDNFSVVVSTRQNIVDYLDVVVSGDTLKIRLKPGTYTNADLKAAVTMPELYSLNLSGASSGTVAGFSGSGDFNLDASGASHADLNIETGSTDIEISGASRVTGQINAQDTRFKISGASRCELSGSAGDANLEVSGASHATLTNFPLAGATLNISGASGAAIITEGTLNVTVSGASSVDYYGNATLNKVNVTGASSLNKK